MATKENMQSQRGALYAITHRMNFLASILSLFTVRLCFICDCVESCELSGDRPMNVMMSIVAHFN